MRNKLHYLLFGLLLAFSIAGCSKQPVQEINAAKTAVDALTAEGAEKDLAADAKKINDALAAALSEIKVQDGKLFKDYKKAKELLVKVASDAGALKSSLAAKKEELKKSAVAAGEASWTALNEAKALLKKAPKKRKAVEGIESEIAALEESLQDVQKLITAEDYSAALNKAEAVKNKAAAVSDRIRQIKEKKQEKKKAAKKR